MTVCTSFHVSTITQSYRATAFLSNSNSNTLIIFIVKDTATITAPGQCAYEFKLNFSFLQLISNSSLSGFSQSYISTLVN